MIKISGLRAYVEVMRRGSLSAAADALNISEPALSRQIAALEADLDIELFSRQQRHLAATEAGEAFLTEAQGLLDYMARIPEIVADIKNKPGGRLRLVSMPRLTSAITAPALVRFRENWPDISVSVEVHPRRSLEQWIAHQHFEIGVGALPTHHASIETEPLFKVPAVVVLHPDHPKASAERVTIQELRSDPLIATKPDTLLWQQVVPNFEKAKIPVTPMITVSQTQLACNLVALGAGYTIADPLIAHTSYGATRQIPLHPKVFLTFGTMWRKGDERMPAALQLDRLLREEGHRFIEQHGLE